MRTRAGMVAVALALGLPGLAGAVKVGGTLYVKAKNTRVMVSPSPTDNAVVILQPGDTVKWEGADATNKQWHRVEAPGGKKGFVFQTNLSTTRPNMEIVVDPNGKQTMDPKKFVASGAAVKALSPGAEKYGNGKKGDYAKAVSDIKAVEALAKAVSTEAIAAHVEEAGLFPVVGPTEKVAQAAPQAPAKGSKKKAVK
ncbi:SH3 domain-containing protein [Pyxidicoccus xibeiensis]|uniref:SH3 domain-containing protein n=1 Tax=Pyxidicoccus xibeiensis TaxID=2906759 RepID=UPI00389AAEA5